MTQSAELLGLPAATGVARGRVRIVNGSIPPAGRGDILVLAGPYKEISPLLAGAAGVVLDAGVPRSPALAAARRLRIPAVTLRNARERLSEGDLAEVDGFAGTVRVLERTQDERKSA